MPGSLRSGGTALVEVLESAGVRLLFGVPGESYLAALDALFSRRNALRLVTARHEGGAAFMAAAHGKLTERPGICFVTRGPGAANAAIAVHTAMQDSSPMILFVGQASTGVRGREAFQEIDYERFFEPIAKWVVEVSQADRIPELVLRAWHTAISGRPGPVVVSLPEDILEAGTGVEAPAPWHAPFVAEVGEGAAVPIIDVLGSAERPLILAGGTGWDSDGRTNLQIFAETNRIPVVTAFRCQDLVDNDSVAFAGDVGVGSTRHVRGLIEAADVVLAAGVRFGEITTGGYELFSVPVPRQRIVHLHPSDRELGKIVIPELAVQGSPQSLFAQLRPVDIGRSRQWQEWFDAASVGRRERFRCPPSPGPVDLVAIMAWLRKNLPSEIILTTGAGNFAIWPGRFLPLRAGSRMLGPQSGAMGYGIPAAIAAKLERPDCMVVCFTGDGDFQMTGQELATAIDCGVDPIVILVNNGMYGTIRMHQERRYPGRVHGTDLRNPDFVALAKAHGANAECVVRTQEFPDAFRRAEASGKVALIELVVDPEAISPSETLSGIRETAFASGVVG